MTLATLIAAAAAAPAGNGELWAGVGAAAAAALWALAKGVQRLRDGGDDSPQSRQCALDHQGLAHAIDAIKAAAQRTAAAQEAAQRSSERHAQALEQLLKLTELALQAPPPGRKDRP